MNIIFGYCRKETVSKKRYVAFGVGESEREIFCVRLVVLADVRIGEGEDEVGVGDLGEIRRLTLRFAVGA